MPSRRLLRRLAGHVGPVRSPGIDFGGIQIATGYEDNTSNIRDAKSGKVILARTTAPTLFSGLRYPPTDRCRSRVMQ